ncbi:MAG: fatty acid desaturase [Actinomycetota bacterium]|nr:fatty acid desaturase [Actinomycetota bacterium]MDA3025746.1 fatty acid desaturase [Actinomycetota bacterium]
MAMTSGARLGGMVPSAEAFAPGRVTEWVQADGRLQSDVRAEVRRIPSWRNALSVVSVYTQTIGLVMFAVWAGPWAWLPVFVLMGRAHAQFASLMHEAAHRLLFRNKRANDLAGRWLIGYPALTNTDAYRRVHMAHHREEFGPEEPDIPLYANYPITTASFRRKLWRDALGRTGLRLLRNQLAGISSPVEVVRHTLLKILLVQAVLIAVSIVLGVWWVYPLFWLAPYLTVWRVINRLRSVAEHGGLMASKDRRVATHSVAQHWLPRFFLVPFNIGFHLAHHVDAGVPFRNLPRFHQMLVESGYVSSSYEYSSYRGLWSALHS